MRPNYGPSAEYPHPRGKMTLSSMPIERNTTQILLNTAILSLIRIRSSAVLISFDYEYVLLPQVRFQVLDSPLKPTPPHLLCSLVSFSFTSTKLLSRHYELSPVQSDFKISPSNKNEANAKQQTPNAERDPYQSRADTSLPSRRD